MFKDGDIVVYKTHIWSYIYRYSEKAKGLRSIFDGRIRGPFTNDPDDIVVRKGLDKW